jgi:hypothetical protein
MGLLYFIKLLINLISSILIYRDLIILFMKSIIMFVIILKFNYIIVVYLCFNYFKQIIGMRYRYKWSNFVNYFKWFDYFNW